MPIFVTYARKDREPVEAVVRDLERSRNVVWMDNELTGGQVWWDTILDQIRNCDLYVFALSPDALKSRACRLELEYAMALGRPLLPVLVRDVAISTAPPAVANTQMIDYRQRTVDAGIALVSAVANRPPAPALPDPLPPPPPPPMSYMNEFRDQLDAPYLSYQQQSHLLVDLRGYLLDDDDREIALALIQELRARRDVAESIGREIDQLLGVRPGGSPEPRSQPSAPSGPSGQSGQSGQSSWPAGASSAGSAPQPAPGATPSGAAPSSAGSAVPPYTQPTPPPYGQPTPPPYVQQTPPGFQPPAYQQPAASYQPIYGAPAGSGRPQPTGPVGPAAGGVPAAHPQAVVVLVLGLVGVLVCGLVGIGAIVMGNKAIREIDAQPGRWGGRQQVAIGRVLGWVGIGLWGLILVFYLIGVASTS